MACVACALALVAGCSPRAKGARTVTTLADIESQTPEASTDASASTPATDRMSPPVSATGIARSAAASGPITFAVIGDYGTDDRNEKAVSELVASWRPGFIITVGDNYYSEVGGTGTGRYDRSVGAYYGDWIRRTATPDPNTNASGAVVCGFFPAMGNHDYSDAAAETYLRYFDLPGPGLFNTSGNERFYDFVQGPVHFFVLNSNVDEPEGTSPSSAQGRWLQQQLAASTSPWNLVYTHHPPYSSDVFHGSTGRMQWPFDAWGADAVIAGHAHSYERITKNGVVYFVNGLGGEGPRQLFATPVAGSEFRYSGAWGAQLVTATDSAMEFRFYSTQGELVDSFSLTAASRRRP